MVPEQQMWLSQKKADRLKRAEKAKSPETGKRVVNRGNPGIMRTLRSLVTLTLANGMKFQKTKVGTPRGYAKSLSI